MNRGKSLLLLFAAILASIGLWLRMSTSPQIEDAAPAHATAPSPSLIDSGTHEQRIVLPVAAEVTLNEPEGLPADDLATLDLLISTYRKNMGGNPVGENEEITAALLGKNSKHLVYLPERGSFLNDSGQLVDRWGSPYFFHAVASDRLEIRSAGPDRELWTSDDVTLSP